MDKKGKISAKQLVKLDLLRRKISEHFSKNPGRIAQFKLGGGDEKVHWRVLKESNGSYRVYEVASRSTSFILEDPEVPPTVRPAQPTGQAQTTTTAQSAEPSINQPIQGQDPWDPDNPSGQFATLVNQVGLKNAMLAMPDDKIQQHFGITKSALKAGGTAAISQPLANPAIQPDDVQLSHKSNTGRVLKEQPTEDDMTGINVEPGDYSLQPTAPSSLQDQSQDISLSTPKAEEIAMKDTLAGQTISGVELESGQNSFEVNLNLVTTEFPATIRVFRGGKVVYTFKGQNYLLQNKWS